MEILSRFKNYIKNLSTERPLTAEELNNAILLEPGDVLWDTFVGGNRTIWTLKYKSYDSLPISNADYNQLVKYRNDIFRLWRVYSNQIQVSSPVNSKKK